MSTNLLIVCLWFILFFFFKQKTAYEMRISDWSSDVCSSDLAQRVADRHDVELDGEAFGQRRWGRKLVGRERLEREPLARQVRRGDDLPRAVGLPGRRPGADRAVAEVDRGHDRRAGGEIEDRRRGE